MLPDLFFKVVREVHQSLIDHFYMQVLYWRYPDESKVFPDLRSSKYSVKKKKLLWSVTVEVPCKELYEYTERND